MSGERIPVAEIQEVFETLGPVKKTLVQTRVLWRRKDGKTAGAPQV